MFASFVVLAWCEELVHQGSVVVGAETLEPDDPVEQEDVDGN